MSRHRLLEAMLQVVQLFELFIINSYPPFLFTPEGTELDHTHSLTHSLSTRLTP